LGCYVSRTTVERALGADRSRRAATPPGWIDCTARASFPWFTDAEVDVAIGTAAPLLKKIADTRDTCPGVEGLDPIYSMS
jgi:hypothetical protein